MAAKITPIINSFGLLAKICIHAAATFPCCLAEKYPAIAIARATKKYSTAFSKGSS